MRLPHRASWRRPASSWRRPASALALAVVLLAGPAAAAQEVPPTTVGDLLVPGTSAPAPSAPATTTPPATTSAPVDEGGGLLDLDLDANQKVWVIVGALLAVAVLIAVLTVVYWHHTRPVPPDGVPVTRRERRQARRDARRAERRERRAPAPEPAAVPPAGADPAAGPLDLDALLGEPQPSRSVFAPDPEDPRPPAG